jgi:hypothetical protein
MILYNKKRIENIQIILLKYDDGDEFVVVVVKPAELVLVSK